jgi:phosphomannomutase
MDLRQKAEEVTQALDPEVIGQIRNIFGKRTVLEILELLRDKPLKIIGKEVRPQTSEMVEMEARIMASNGITVLTAPHFSDSSNIYLTSFLCFLLGSDGGTFFTPSHSAVYVLGRKVLDGKGAQLLPEVYSRFIEIMNDIVVKAKNEGYVMRIAESNNLSIFKTLSYEKVSALFASALAPNRTAIEAINLAASRGFKVTLNTLSGSAAKSLAYQLTAMGIMPEVFNPLWAEEDQFFQVGYTVVQKDGEYLVDHLGVDTTAPAVVRQIPYAEVLADTPTGTLIYECDPDNDRFVVKQILPESAKPLCETFGIDTYPLGDGRILVAPSPNKTFLLLDIADYERLKASGEWDQNQMLYFPTYVSTNAWVEFAEYLAQNEGNLSLFLSRVGFKNFNFALAKIQDWWFNRPEEETLTVTPQLGEPVTLNRTNNIRVLSKEEESGGRTSGFPRPVMNILGDQTFSMPEKAVGDALLAHLSFMANRFLAGQTMEVPEIIRDAYDRYGLISRVDARMDVLHGDQGIIAQVPPAEGKLLKAKAAAEKANFNNFFFSLSAAIRGSALTLERAKEILKRILPEWADTWDCLDQIDFVEEELMPGVFRPEGAVFAFKAKDGKVPMVTKFKFRPSGTDPLKSKVYIDAQSASSAELRAIVDAFNLLKPKDLYAVLDYYGIAYKEEKPAEVSLLALQPAF